MNRFVQAALRAGAVDQPATGVRADLRFWPANHVVDFDVFECRDESCFIGNSLGNVVRIVALNMSPFLAVMSDFALHLLLATGARSLYRSGLSIVGSGHARIPALVPDSAFLQSTQSCDGVIRQVIHLAGGVRELTLNTQIITVNLAFQLGVGERCGVLPNVVLGHHIESFVEAHGQPESAPFA